jgi:ABC-type cobalamin/Fe3+-siderophores transport system ATPase subunit
VEAPGLIVDEPLASLDPGHQIDVMELLAAEARAGALVIAVLHDLTLAARHCDRLLLIDGGELVADGPPADVLTPERLAAVYGVRALVGQHRAGRWWCRWSARETDPYLSHSCRIRWAMMARHILVVEDDPLIAGVICRGLGEQGTRPAMWRTARLPSRPALRAGWKRWCSTGCCPT